jgi:hypothetical protein
MVNAEASIRIGQSAYLNDIIDQDIGHQGAAPDACSEQFCSLESTH